MEEDHTSQVPPVVAMLKFQACPQISLDQFLLLEPGVRHLEITDYTHTRQRPWVPSLEPGNPGGARLMSLL